MRKRSTRALLHAAAALTLAGASIFITGGIGRADTTELAARPDVFGGMSTASSFHFFFDRTPGLFPLSDLFHVELPYSTSSFDSSGTDSSSSALIYPGGGLLGAPGLICGELVSCPFSFPAYPLIANANYPTTPDGSAEASQGVQSLGGILSVQPNLITAHADQNGVDSKTDAVGASLLDVLTTGTVSSESQQFFKNGALVVVATSTVHNLSVLGGLLNIGSVTSTSTSTVDGAKLSQSSSDTSVVGATLAGVPIGIDDTGIHLASSGDKGAAAKTLNSALAAIQKEGISIRLLSEDQSVKSGNVSSSTGGLLISFNENTPDVPLPIVPSLPLPIAIPAIGGDYMGTISIGGAGTLAYANGAAGSDASTGSIGGFLGNPTTDGESTGTTTDVIGQPSTGGTEPGVSAPGSTSVSPPSIATPATQNIQAAGVDQAVGRLKTFALVLAAYPLLILVGSLFRAPPRLPRGSG